MWNPFRSVKLAAVVPAKDDEKPEFASIVDDQYREQIEQAQLRSLLARTQIGMIHENLARRSFNQLRGGNVPAN